MLSVLLSVACDTHTHGGGTPLADSLFVETSNARYRDLAALDTSAAMLETISVKDDELLLVAHNAKAYSALMRMDYALASQLYKEVFDESGCEIESFVADVGMMTLCYRVSDNRSFFDYRASALARIKRIDEEVDFLSQGDKERFSRAKIEFDIVSVCYFSNLAMLKEKNEAIEQLRNDIKAVEDFDLRLYARMLLANNTPDAVERLSLLGKGLNVAESRYATWLCGNYRLLLAISLRDSVQLALFAEKFPEETARLLPHGETLGELPFILASRATDDFAKYGDRYMMVEAMAVHASCYIQNARFYEALALLDIALAEIKGYYTRYYPEQAVLCENPLYFIYEDVELVSDAAAGIYNIPECLLSVCREASCAYAGVGNKELSDVNREAYLELLRTTRMNKQLESRASTAEAEAYGLRVPLLFSLLLLLFLCIFLVFVYRRRRFAERMYSHDRIRLLKSCRVLMSSIPSEFETKEELCEAVAGILNIEFEGFAGDTNFSFSAFAHSETGLPYTACFNVVYFNGGEPDVLVVASSVQLTPEKSSIIELLVPYIAVAIEEGLRLNDLSDEHERVVEQRAAHAIYLADHKRENLLKRVSLSVVGGMRPFMDRIINELRVLDSSLSPDDRLRKLEYVAELTSKLDDLNVILERWIKTRQGEYNLRIDNFALSSLFDIIGKRSGLLANRGIALELKGGTDVVKADRALTLFMINTLVDNAAKFTPAGGSISLESVEGDGFVEVSVADTGVGMSQSDIDCILNAKVYDASRIGEDNPLLSPKSKGGGFGLMNCKGIIEKYRKSDSIFSVCNMCIKSEKGVGSRFSFRLPKGVLRVLLPVMFLLLPWQAKADNALFERVNECADSVYMSNVNGNYEEAFVQAQHAIELLNEYCRNSAGGVDTLMVGGERAAELAWWRDGVFPDSLCENIYYNILDIRNELAVASLALHRWDTYRRNNYIYTTLYRLVHEDKDIAQHYAILQHTVNVQYATIALACFLIFVFLLYYVVSYVRHNIIRSTNERLVLEMNSRLLRLAAGNERTSVEELAQCFVNEFYDCLGENMRMKSVAMLLRTGKESAPVLVCCPSAAGHSDNIFIHSVYESGEEYIAPGGTMRVLPLFASVAGERQHVGALEIVTERPLSEGETLSLELVTGYLASTAYHSAVLVTSGYRAIDEMEEEAERVKFEENRLHVQNMVIDNCLSVIKHETIYYPGRVREIVSKALRNVTDCGGDVVAMRELMDYYSSIFGILSNCALRELGEMSFSPSKMDVVSLFEHVKSYTRRRAGKLSLDVHVEYEPVDLVLQGDRVFVEFLFESLVDAALKRPIPGTLTLRAAETADFVKIELLDTRFEMTSEEAAELFTPTRHNIGDNGEVLGMEYLVAKEIVRLHEDYTGKYGGRMEAHSDVSGTVIMFTLPK